MEALSAIFFIFREIHNQTPAKNTDGCKGHSGYSFAMRHPLKMYRSGLTKPSRSQRSPTGLAHGRGKGQPFVSAPKLGPIEIDLSTHPQFKPTWISELL